MDLLILLKFVNPRKIKFYAYFRGPYWIWSFIIWIASDLLIIETIPNRCIVHIVLQIDLQGSFFQLAWRLLSQAVCGAHFASNFQAPIIAAF